MTVFRHGPVTADARPHPLRMAMYSYLTDTGSATATSMAKHLGESTGQTSYHLRQLEKHGVVEEDTGRGSGRERWWKPVGFAVPTYELAQDESNRPAIQAMYQATLNHRAAALGRWLSVENREDPEWVRASVGHGSRRLSEARLVSCGDFVHLAPASRRAASARTSPRWLKACG